MGVRAGSSDPPPVRGRRCASRTGSRASAAAHMRALPASAPGCPRAPRARSWILKCPSSSPGANRSERTMGRDQLGVIAAGHPLTADAGATVLRRGGNAVDAALGAMLVSFACEPLLTGLGAGGYMLVVSPGEAPVLLDFFVEAPGRGANHSRRAELVPISVSFGDAIQVFNIGAASVGCFGVPAGV